MKREIKFRYWDSRKMYHPYGNEVVRSYWDKHDGSYLYQSLWDENQEYCDASTGNELSALMQFTGLHDKNGKDIYEGDIMRRQNDDASWVVQWNEQNAGFYFKKKGHRYLEPSDCAQSKIEDNPITIDTMEVIGNIYENPELLKPS